MGAKPETVKAHIHIGIDTKSDNTGTIESRAQPPTYLSVEGWKDCMESKDIMGSWDAWCLPAQKPKSNKCLEKSWKALQEPNMGTISCAIEGNQRSPASPTETQCVQPGGSCVGGKECCRPNDVCESTYSLCLGPTPWAWANLLGPTVIVTTANPNPP